jgi:hypothetical protein
VKREQSAGFDDRCGTDVLEWSSFHGLIWSVSVSVLLGIDRYATEKRESERSASLLRMLHAASMP